MVKTNLSTLKDSQCTESPAMYCVVHAWTVPDKTTKVSLVCMRPAFIVDGVVYS